LINELGTIYINMLYTITDILDLAEGNIKLAEERWEAVKSTMDSAMTQYVTQALREVKTRVSL